MADPTAISRADLAEVRRDFCKIGAGWGPNFCKIGARNLSSSGTRITMEGGAMADPTAGEGPAALTTAEVAARLGVKPATVYAYVSRGLLPKHPASTGRGSLFDPADVDRLGTAGGSAIANGPGSGRGAADRAGAMETIRSGLTRIGADSLSYRGADVMRLATAHRFETVAGFLWTGDLDPGLEMTAPLELVRLARAVTAPLPAGTRPTDRLRVIVAALSAADPLRFETRPDAVVETGRSLLAVCVDGLPLVGRDPVAGATDDAAMNGTSMNLTGTDLAVRLWPRLTEVPLDPYGVAALNAALVLLADHGLAASTLAARVAASTRADPYAVVSAGLGAMDGPYHGAASELARRLLAESVRRDPTTALAEHLRTGNPVPGFGHVIYRGPDPRAVVLAHVLGAHRPAGGVLDTARALSEVVARRTRRQPNVDLALATLAEGCAMVPGAEAAVFAIARMAGWIAHALEEYAEPGLRFRPRGVYVGPS